MSIGEKPSTNVWSWTRTLDSKKRGNHPTEEERELIEEEGCPKNP